MDPGRDTGYLFRLVVEDLEPPASPAQGHEADPVGEPEVSPGQAHEEQLDLPGVSRGPAGSPRKADAPALAEEATDATDVGAYRVKLDAFEGPLDLLLHLVRKHELDIFDIPVGFITERYLEYLALMQALQIDVASEYLVWAATLTHLKSRMPLPPDPSQPTEEDGSEAYDEDPRTDLVRRLLAYQKYKQVASALGGRPMPGRDLFGRGTDQPEPGGEAPLALTSVFRLFDAFEKVLKRAEQHADHHVLFERVSITERIVQLTERLADRRRLRFEELFEPAPGTVPTRFDLVVTFLALLEMCKMHVVRVAQPDPLGEIVIEFAPKHLPTEAEPPRAEPAAEAEPEAETAPWTDRTDEPS